MSRPWNSLNKARPAWFARIGGKRPRCFASQQAWDSYLDAVHQESQEDESLRAQLHRGQPPDYCEDCTAKHQLRMHAAGLCHPPAGAQSPLMPIELQGTPHEPE